jgi:hypothetical protein
MRPESNSPKRKRGGPRAEALSRQNLPYYSSLHIGEAKIPSRIPISEPLVIEPKLIQDCRVQIVDAHAVLDGLETKIVSPAVGEPTANAAARHPHRVAVRIVVAPIASL